MLATIFFPLLMFFQVPTPMPSQPAPRPTETPQARPSPSPEPVEPPVVTHHSIRVSSRTLNYTVTTGYMPLKNAVSGDTEARIFYMAYTLDGVAAGEKRPLMFSFN